MPLLKTRGPERHFRGVTPPDACGPPIEPGDVMGLMGHNRAGKNTPLTMLLGQIRPDSCHVLPDGRSSLDAPAHRIARSGAAPTHQVPRPVPSPDGRPEPPGGHAGPGQSG
ncbi:ATP-binding cassette domain-containing protein [Streptomyces sp. NPDC004008]